jgi:hypothetical protein
MLLQRGAVTKDLCERQRRRVGGAEVRKARPASVTEEAVVGELADVSTLHCTRKGAASPTYNCTTATAAPHTR